MSFWASRNSNAEENSSAEFPKKPYTKIDLIGKLHIIHALDNGQPKTDIARDYGVHPQTITYIYKQKEALLRKYSQKYNLLKEVRCINLNQTLLNWITSELKRGKIIKEEQLRVKAEEIIDTMSEDFNCIDDWLLDFRRRNNIIKFTSKIECSNLAKEEWDNFISDLDAKDVYISGAFGLFHSLDFDQYVCKQKLDKYVILLFIVNCSGTDKKELAVVGDELLDDLTNIKSFPVQYFHCNNITINSHLMQRYLTNWDYALQLQNRKVSLVIDLPDSILTNIKCDNIEIKKIPNLEFVSKNVDIIETCFKFHYRRIQMTKKILYNKDSRVMTLIDYMQIMSAAWHCVSSEYVHRLFFPLENGSLYFNPGDVNDSNHSLLQWCKLHNIPCDLEMYSDLLDNYIQCDKDLPIINPVVNDVMLNVNDSLLENDLHPVSGIQAYQALKRLITYLQSQNAEMPVVNSAKKLEDHLELGALQEIQQIMASNNNPE